MSGLPITLIDKIKSYSSKVGCFGPVSEIIPNPCIINPWIKEEKKRVWTVIGYPDHALVVFHEEDKCYRVERDIKPDNLTN